MTQNVHGGDPEKQMKRSEDKTTEQSSEELQKSLLGNENMDTFDVRLGQAEQAPLESKEGYQFLVDHSKEIILVLNKKGKIIFANKYTLKDFGYFKEELIGKSITQFLTAGSITKALFALAQEFLGRPQPELEVQAKTKSGEIKYLSVAEGSVPIHENGKLIGMMISANDITGRRRAEKERQEAEKRFRDLWEHAPVAYHTMDTKGIITNANQTEANMLGYAKEELVGKPIFDFILPEQRAEAATRFQQKIVGHRIARAENRVFVKKDGSKINVAIDDSLERDGDGRVIGIRTTMVDITKLMVAEKSSKKSEEHFRDLVEKSGIAISIDDEEGNLIYCNSRYADIFGYSMEEMRCQPISALVHSDDAERVMPYYKGRLQGKDVPSRYEFKGIRKDGSIIDLEVDGSVLREGERLIGTRSYMWDITDRKLAEDILRKRSARLELVHHIQSEIPLSADIEAVLNQTAESIGKTFRYYKISINLYDQATNEIEYLTGWNKTGLPIPRGHRQKLGQGLIGMAGLSKRAILANDVSKEPDYIPYHLTETKAELVIPLLVQDHLIGVLDLQATKVDAFSKEDVSVLESIASYIAFIIDRKKRDEALRLSEERYRSFVECSQGGVFIIDHAYRIIYANEEMTHISGYSFEDIIGQDFRIFLDDESQRLAVDRYIRRQKGENVPSRYELNIVHKDGEKRKIEVSSTVIENSAGNVETMCQVLDITERKRAEGMLVKSEKRFRQLSDLLPQIVFETDIKGNLTFANQYGIKLFGYSPEDFQSGVNIFALVAPEDREWVEERFKEILSGSGATGREYRMVRKDGGIFPILMHANAIVEDGVPIGARGIGIDITERKQTEDELRQVSNKLRQALGSIVSVVTATVEMKDPYTAGHQRRVADLARAIATEMNLSKDQIEGIRIAATIHDLGKLFVPGEILSKPGKLNEYELNLIRLHSQVGFDILKDIEFPWPIAQIVYQHHERMDGSGYPQGLKGEQAIIEARILGVADVVEAMSSHRPYRPALGIDKALEEISQNKGILYDSAVVNACLKIYFDKKFEF